MIRWAAPAAWAALVVLISLVPLGEVGVPRVPGADKLVHLAMYFLLAGLVNHAARRPCLTCGLSVTAGCGVLGGVIELFQRYVPGRAPDVWDALVNVAAAAVGSFVYIRWRRRKAQGGLAAGASKPRTSDP